MDKNNNKFLLFGLIAIATIILLAVGSTFAYFSATMSSEENAISARSAEFTIDLNDDVSLIKSNVIPSIEKYVDIASKRVDESGNYLKPHTDEVTGKLVTANTACIDDNLNEICSIYTFTIINRMTETDIPLYITLNPGINSFENLYFKVLDKDKHEVIGATKLAHSENSEIEPIVLTEINNTLAKATNADTPSTVTYSIVMWIMETNENQNTTDGGKVFAATLNVKASGVNGNGITGVISASGTE